MGILFILFFIILVIIQVYYLIKSVKTKDNKNWVILFSITISSIISVIVFGWYSIINKYLEWGSLVYFVLCWLVIRVYILILIIAFILKIIEVRKKDKLTTEKLPKNRIRKLIILPSICVISSVLLLCGIEYSKYILEERAEIKEYNIIKRKEISKMADFLNNKYKLNIQESDCIYYREEDYSSHSGIFGTGPTVNIPYIAVFQTNNEKITVVDRKGFISDNKQLKDINQFITDYYQEKTGINFDYVEFYKSYGGSWSGNDNVINKVLQTTFNKQITNNNIGEFINCILQESNLSIRFYIKNNENDRESLIDDITKKLNNLKNYSNITKATVYGYNGDLDRKHKEIEFPEEHKEYGNTSADFNDEYKFGCYYIDLSTSNLAFSLEMDLDRGYSSNRGTEINGWKYILK